MAELTHESIRKFARQYFQECLNRTDEIVSLVAGDSVLDREHEISGARALLEAFQREYHSGDFQLSTIQDAERILQQNAIAGKAGLDLVKLLRASLVRARIEDTRIAIAKLSGDFSASQSTDPWFLGMDVTGYAPLPGERAKGPSVLTLSEAIELFQASRKDRIAVKTAESEALVLSLCLAVLGEKIALQAIELQQIRDVRNAITRLPAHHSKKKEFAGLSVLELIKLPDAEKLSQKTQWKYFSAFRTFLRWAVAEGYLEKMPGASITLPKPSKVDEQDARSPFSEEDLLKLVGSPLYRGHASPARRSIPGDLVVKDGKWWIPLIGLLSGMRLGEIVQLLHADIKSDRGIFYFDINRNEDGKKKVKNASSIRRVPIHQTLIDFGFLQIVGTGPGRVFSDIRPGADGYFSHNFSKWFARYLDSVGITSPKIVFHSLRHNFKDALSLAGIPTPVAMALMGHADGSVHATYGSALPIALLNENLQKLVFLDGRLSELLSVT